LDEVLEEQVDDIGEETGPFAEVLVLEYGKGLLEHRIETFVSCEDVRNRILLNFQRHIRHSDTEDGTADFEIVQKFEIVIVELDYFRVHFHFVGVIRSLLLVGV